MLIPPSSDAFKRSSVRFGFKGDANKAKAPEAASSGAAMGKAQQNGIWVTTERLPAKNGGLGEVSKTIPESIATLMPQKDLRIIVPYLNQHEEQQAKQFEDSGQTLTLNDQQGNRHEFQVLQSFEPAPGYRPEQRIGNWVYAIRNDEFFRAPDPKNPGHRTNLSDYTYAPEAGEYEKVMMFNRAAAKLIPLLDGNNAQSARTRLHRFGEPESSANGGKNGKQIDFVMAHDWLTGPVLNELPDQSKMQKIFMLHNRYDKVQTPRVAQRVGMSVPQSLYRDEKLFSPLELGIVNADVVIGNRNFVHTLLNTDFGKGLQFVEALRQKSQAGRVQDMHHGLSATYTPIGKLASANLEENEKTEWLTTLEKKIKPLEEKQQQATANKANPSLSEAETETLEQLKRVHASAKQGFQFEKLRAKDPARPTLQEMHAYKAANKLALQRKYGLNPDKNAILMGWAARLEPEQKGFFLLQRTMKQILESKAPQHQRVQFIIFGDTKDPEIVKWVREINRKYPGRVYLPNEFTKKADQMNAGCDFTILPSLYEPYGLTQLEAMKMGSIPIVNPVDGLRASVTDDEIKAQLKQDPNSPGDEAVWSQPQNGVLMQPLDTDPYIRYIRKRLFWEKSKVLLTRMEQQNAAGRPQDSIDLKALNDVLEEARKQRSELKITLENKQAKAVAGTADGKALPALSDGALSDMEARELKKLPEQTNRLQVIQHEVGMTHQLTSSQLEELRQILDLTPDDQTLNRQESQKLQAAMERAIQLMDQPLAANADYRRADQVRLDAYHFVNTAHSWESIVSEKYKRVLEGYSVDQAGREARQADLVAPALRNSFPVQSPPPSPPTTQTRIPDSATQNQRFAALWQFWANLQAQWTSLMAFLTTPFRQQKD